MVAIISDLVNLASVTAIWIHGYTTYRVLCDVWGKRCYRLFPIIRKHNPVTIATIRKQLISKLNRNSIRKLNRKLLNSGPLRSRVAPCAMSLSPILDDSSGLSNGSSILLAGAPAQEETAAEHGDSTQDDGSGEPSCEVVSEASEAETRPKGPTGPQHEGAEPSAAEGPLKHWR